MGQPPRCASVFVLHADFVDEFWDVGLAEFEADADEGVVLVRMGWMRRERCPFLVRVKRPRRYTSTCFHQARFQIYPATDETEDAGLPILRQGKKNPFNAQGKARHVQTYGLGLRENANAAKPAKARQIPPTKAILSARRRTPGVCYRSKTLSKVATSHSPLVTRLFHADFVYEF